MLLVEARSFCARLYFDFSLFNPLRAKITKWSNTLEQFVGNLPTNCLSVFDHFVGLALKGLKGVLSSNGRKSKIPLNRSNSFIQQEFN